MQKSYKMLSKDETAILCPDRSCTLFTKPNCRIPCESDCPHKDEMKKIVLCGCGEMIVLDSHHHSAQRVDHDCDDGNTRSTFVRNSGKYHRIFEMPVKS